MNKKWDFQRILKRVSTWLAGVSGASVIAFASLPDRMKEELPDWTLLTIAVVTVFLVPIATSFKQNKK